MRSVTTVPPNAARSSPYSSPHWFRRHWRALTAVVLSLLALLVVAVGVVGWIGSERVIHPARKVEAHSLSEYDFAPVTETVHFKSLDGTPLAAWFVPAEQTPAPTVILLHGWGRSKAEQLPKADFLHRAGYSVLLLDFRNRGESGGDAVTMGAREPLDVHAAVDYVLTRSEVDPNRIALEGVSLGSSVGILEMKDDPRVKAIVSESSFADLKDVVNKNFENFIHLPPFPFAPVTLWIAERRLNASVGQVRPVSAIARIGDRPALIMHGLADTDIPADSGKRLVAAASGPTEFWEIPGATHAQGYKAQSREYERRVLAFLARYLGAPATPAARGQPAGEYAMIPR
jgi:pimeloyl-ACP methyl ester carboxylesterase